MTILHRQRYETFFFSYCYSRYCLFVDWFYPTVLSNMQLFSLFVSAWPVGFRLPLHLRFSRLHIRGIETSRSLHSLSSSCRQLLGHPQKRFSFAFALSLVKFGRSVRKKGKKTEKRKRKKRKRKIISSAGARARLHKAT